ncbi:MAG TPA: family 1 glycosylhydrolase, partial [Devosia sp.]
MFSVERRDFGPNFLFGAATAAYQIEGGQTDGRGPSIWDTFAATPGNVKNLDDGHMACDHYNRWREDLDLLRDGGFDAYRFSLAWPRLIPGGTGAVNQAGIDFYDRLIDGMLERGLKPFATLYHWDLPSPLQDKGGWMNRDIAAAFSDYAALVAKHYGDRLSAVATINEPWCVAFLSHFLGIHAPGYRDIRAAARAMHHVLLAHGTAVDALRAEGAKNLGIVLNLEKSEPLTGSDEDKTAFDYGDALFNRWYLGGVFKGQYPEILTKALAGVLPEGWERDMEVISRPLDWLGINYYTRGLYKYDGSRSPFPIAQQKGDLERNDLGWEIYPQGLTDLLVRVSNEYTKLPVYVTENGMS